MSAGAESRLTPAQLEVARRVLDEESARRDHLVVYLSGAHAYGFPSPDSDLDLKAIHVAPTRSMLGLSPIATTFDRAEVLDGVEIDYTSNELAHVLRGILQGNGNFAERVLGETALRASPLLDTLRPIVARSISRRFHRHYRGFAQSQLGALSEAPTVKRLLYVLRTTLTGTHLLRTGRVVTDVTELFAEHALGGARELVERKRAGERTVLDTGALERWRGRIAQAFDDLDAAERSSPLPPESPNVEELDAWLVEVRRTSL